MDDFPVAVLAWEDCRDAQVMGLGLRSGHGSNRMFMRRVSEVSLPKLTMLPNSATGPSGAMDPVSADLACRSYLPSDVVHLWRPSTW